MGLLKYCSVLLNMVCGYPIGKDCVVCSDSLAFGCVLSTWVLSSIGFSFARTSLCRRDGLCMLLLGVLGKYGSIFYYFWINFQCFLSICSSL